MRFDKIILMGSGKIAYDCLRHLLCIIDKEDMQVLETQQSSLSMLDRLCQKESIIYSIITAKKEIENFLIDEIKDCKTLIISANNRFIFTPNIINGQGVEIINFHYALLPKYRGMNIPTWVIFNGEKQTGITWHFVTEKVDHGKVIEQRIISINETTNAFEITRKGMALGIEAFRSFIGDLLEKKSEGKDVIYPDEDIIYYNSNLPMQGILDLSQPVEDIIRLLKSFDYGGMRVIPYLRLCYEENAYEVHKYKIEETLVISDRVIEYSDGVLLLKDSNKEIKLYLEEVRE